MAQGLTSSIRKAYHGGDVGGEGKGCRRRVLELGRGWEGAGVWRAWNGGGGGMAGDGEMVGGGGLGGEDWRWGVEEQGFWVVDEKRRGM